MYAKLFAATSAAMLLSTTAFAEKGDVLVRLRAIAVVPNESSQGVVPAFPAEKVSVDNSVMPEVDFTYMWTDHIGTELILATTKHDVNGTTGTTGRIGRLASAWVLPPTLTLQYHFLPEGRVRPYVGAGVNYTFYYSEKASSGLEGAVGSTDVSMKPSFGYAVQAGVDVPVGKRLFVNLDLKYIDMRTTARLQTAALGLETVHVRIDPLVFGIGIGTKF